MKKIKEIQNEETQLEKLAAQRILYSLAKRGLWLNFIFSIPFIILYFIFSLYYPCLNDFKVYIGTTLSFLNIILFIPYQNNKIKTAAIIQEQFDKDVLQIKWNPFLIKKSVDNSLIIEYKKKYLKKFKDYSKLENWYNINDEGIPIEFSRLVCQKENVWWDKEIRSNYNLLMLIIPITIILILLFLNYTIDADLKMFVDEIFYLSPTILFSIEQYSKNKFSIETLEELNDKIQFNIEKAIHGKFNNEELETNSRLLQDRIFFHRLGNILIFDIFFNLCKKKTQQISQESTQDYINQYKQFNKIFI